MILTPVGLGIVGGSIPGPILTSVFTEVLAGGFKKSLRIIFIAMLTESVLAFGIFAVIFNLNIPAEFFYLLSLAGSAVLVWLASQVWRIKKIENNQKSIFTLNKIILITVFNGPLWIFWLTVGVPQAFLLTEKYTFGYLIFLFFFQLGWLLANLFWAFVFARFRPLLTKEKFVPYVFKFFALLLIVFAIKATYSSLNMLFVF